MRPQLLLLDEPTNHLDIDARDALVRALAEFSGAVVLITHDPDLVTLVADRLWLVADGTAKPYEGDLDDYRGLLAEQARPAYGRKHRHGETTVGTARRHACKPRRLRRQAKDAETALARLSAERAKLEAKLARTRRSTRPAGRPMSPRPNTRLAAIARETESAEQAWLEAEEALAQA